MESIEEKRKVFPMPQKILLARDCTLLNKCLNCSQLHHVSICPCLVTSISLARQSYVAVQNQQNPGQATGIRFKEFCPSDQSKTVNSNQKQVEVNQTQGTVGIVVDSQTSILLQTACAVVLKPTQRKCSAVARILLDSGSQRLI